MVRTGACGLDAPSAPKFTRSTSNGMGSYCSRRSESGIWRGLFANGGRGVYTEHGWLKIKNPNYSQSSGRHEMFTRFHEGRAQGSRSKG